MAFEIDKEEWHIKNDSDADWALKRIAEQRADKDRILSIGEKEIEDIKVSMEKTQKSFDSFESYMNGKLLEYFLTVEHRKTKAGTQQYKLLRGTLQMKPAAKKPIVNEEQLVEWLAANDMTDYIKTKQSPAWGDLKKSLDLSGDVPVVKETGEVVEGVTLEDVPETFEIKLSKGDEE